MFILDRRNGKPIFGVEERPVPASDVPGEASWPTQPFPLKPAPLGRHSFSPDEIATVTPEQKKVCTDLLATEGGMNSGGPYTHYGSKLTIVFPGTLGTTNWPGMSYNPDLGYLFVNTVNIADVGKVTKNEDAADPAYERNSPWGMYARFWNNDKFWPCQQPPWGELWAINANTGDVAWKVPFGVIEELDAERRSRNRNSELWRLDYYRRRACCSSRRQTINTSAPSKQPRARFCGRPSLKPERTSCP